MKKMYMVFFSCVILATSRLCAAGAEDDNASRETIIVPDQMDDEPQWDAFGQDQSQEHDRVQTIDFSKPPKPSRLEVLVRRIGIPIFLRYVQVYNWVRNWVYWVRTRFVGNVPSTVNEHDTAN